MPIACLPVLQVHTVYSGIIKLPIFSGYLMSSLETLGMCFFINVYLYLIILLTLIV